MQESKKCRFDSWVGKIPWRRAWPPSLVFLPGESHGQKSLAGYCPWNHKESDMTEATEHTCTHTHTHMHTHTDTHTHTIYIKHEILKFCLVLDICKKVYYWYLFWISRFKVWWDCYYTKCPKRYLCFKYLINLPYIDIYSLGKFFLEKYNNKK